MNITDQNPSADRLHPISGTFRPLDDRVLIRRLPDLDVKSALFMPECVILLSKRGVVVAVGPGKRDKDGFRRPLAVRPNDIVYFGRYTDFDDGEYLLIQEADIVGVCS